jgi:chromosome segregation ATPase
MDRTMPIAPNLLIIAGIMLMAFVSVALLFQNRRLKKSVAAVNHEIATRKARYAEEHNKRIQRLKQEIMKREQLIKRLKEELKNLKEQQKPEELQSRILSLTSEKAALEEEFELEQKNVDEPPPVDIQEVIKLKEELSEARVDRTKYRTLLTEYQKRYQDILSWGNRTKKELKDLEEQNQALEDRVQKMKQTIRDYQTRLKGPFS